MVTDNVDNAYHVVSPTTTVYAHQKRKSEWLRGGVGTNATVQ